MDRGKKGLEVFLLLLACFLAFPNGVFLNRGNHEDSVMNARYGFIREVQQKYKVNKRMEKRKLKKYFFSQNCKNIKFSAFPFLF